MVLISLPRERRKADKEKARLDAARCVPQRCTESTSDFTPVVPVPIPEFAKHYGRTTADAALFVGPESDACTRILTRYKPVVGT